MLIDPFTVVAQIVNFTLLVWLLSRFLYGPVTRAMDAREARVREEVEGARRLRAESEAEGERYRALRAGFEAKRETLLGEMHAELDALRHEQMRQARAEVKELRERWYRTLEQEKEDFLQELRLQLGRAGLAVVRRALRELADEDLEERIIERFVNRLRTMGTEDRERIAAAVRAAAISIRTAFPLYEAQRAALIEALAETFGVEPSARFETDPELMAGVVLQAGGIELAWTLDGYLQGFEEAMREALHESAQTGRPDDDA